MIRATLTENPAMSIGNDLHTQNEKEIKYPEVGFSTGKGNWWVWFGRKVCDYINHFGYYKNKIGILKAWGGGGVSKVRKLAKH
jgi:hypothetical protein